MSKRSKTSRNEASPAATEPTGPFFIFAGVWSDFTRSSFGPAASISPRQLAELRQVAAEELAKGIRYSRIGQTPGSRLTEFQVSMAFEDTPVTVIARTESLATVRTVTNVLQRQAQARNNDEGFWFETAASRERQIELDVALKDLATGKGTSKATEWYELCASILAQVAQPATQAKPQAVSPRSVNDLARENGVDAELLRKRLDRERGKNQDCYVEMDDSERKSNEPKYLYRPECVRHVIDELKAAKSSSRRPAH